MQIPSTGGPITSSSIATKGSGYAAGDTGALSQSGSDNDALYVVDSVDGGGGILTYHLVSGGSLYRQTNGLFFMVAHGVNGGSQPGTGTGFSLNVLSVGPSNPKSGDGTMKVSVDYTVEDVQ